MRSISPFLLLALLLGALGRGIAALVPIEPAITPGTTDIFPAHVSTQVELVAKPGHAGTIHPKAEVGTLTAGVGRIAVALDSDDPAAKQLDLLRFDFTGTAQFADRALKVSLANQASADGGPITLSHTMPVARDGVTIPVRLSGTIWPAQHFAFLTLAALAQETITLGKHAVPVRVVDLNLNLRFGDAFPAINDVAHVQLDQYGDLLQIDLGDGTFTHHDTIVHGFCGQPVYVNGAWYVITAAANGKALTASSFTGPTGMVAGGSDGWGGLFIGKQYMIWLSGAPRACPLPVDDYRVMMTLRTLPPARPGELPMPVYSAYADHAHAPVLAVKPDATATLDIARSPVPVVTVRKYQRSLTFALKLCDANGRETTLLNANRQVVGDRVNFEVLNADGQRVYSSVFEHG